MTDQSNQPPAPEELGYPADYNPYQAQKKRMKKALKQLRDSRENFARMGSCFEQFDNEAQSLFCATIVVTLTELEETLIEFFCEYM